jgi:hypothetical protein
VQKCTYFNLGKNALYEIFPHEKKNYPLNVLTQVKKKNLHKKGP